MSDVGGKKGRSVVVLVVTGVIGRLGARVITGGVVEIWSINGSRGEALAASI